MITSELLQRSTLTSAFKKKTIPTLTLQQIKIETKKDKTLQ